MWNFVTTLKQQKRKLSLNGESYEKLRLGQYFQLEVLKIQLNQAVRKGKSEEFKTAAKEIIELQTGVTELDQFRPADIIGSLFEIFDFNRLAHIPVFLIPPPKNPYKKDELIEFRWDYPGRFFAEWINLLAQNYHWALDAILALDVDMAAHLIQEILLNKQYDKEFQYQLSELAYHYDEGSKKSKFVPLKRPYWMDDKLDITIVKTKIPKKFLPVGTVVNVSGMETMVDDTV